MKKTFILCALVLATAAFSCKKEETGTSGKQQAQLVDVEFTATHSEVSLRSSIEGGTIVWSAGDSVSVYDGVGVRTFRTETGGRSALFKGKAVQTTQYYAVYPAGTGIAFADGRFSAVIPSSQKADVAGSFAPGSNVSVGIVKPVNGGGLGAEMKSIAGYINLTVAEGNKTLTAVKVKSGGDAPICGKVVVAGNASGETVTSILGTGTEVSLVPSDGKATIAPGNYYLAVNPASLGDSITVTFESGLFETVVRSIVRKDTISIGKTLSLGSFNPLDDVLAKVGGPEVLDSSADPQSAYGFDYNKLNARHPRLLLSQEEFMNLLYKLKYPEQYPTLQRMHTNAIAYAETVLSRGPAKIGDITNAEDKTKALSGAREVVVQLFTRAYAYRTTKDKKFLDAALTTLRYVCGLSDWGDKSYLTTGETSFAVALAYDWLYYDLSLADRQLISNALRKNGIATAAAGKMSYKSTNNWNQVTNGGIVSASIATYDLDKQAAAARIEACIPSNIKAQEVIYKPDGNTSEGYGYWSYGTEYQTVINEGLLSAFGKAGGLMNVEGFSKTADYIVYMNGPCGDFGFADGGRGKGSALYAPWWFAARYNRPDLLFHELRNMRETGYFYERFTCMIPVVLSKFADIPMEAQAPSSKLWAGNGETPIALARTAWNNDAGDVFAGLKGGDSKASHCHMDVGTFVYDAYGIRWADDLLRENIYSFYDKNLQADGFGRKNYFDFHQKSGRWDILESANIMHNCLLFYNNDGSIDKLHPTDFDVTGKGVLEETYNTDAKLGAKMDLSTLYRGQVESAKRSVVILNGKDLAVIDEIKALASTEAKLEWRMITKAATSLDYNHIMLTKSGKTVYLKTTNDKSLSVEYHLWKCVRPDTWPVRQWNVVNQDYSLCGFSATVPAGQTAVFTTVITDRREDNNSETGDNERPEL